MLFYKILSVLSEDKKENEDTLVGQLVYPIKLSTVLGSAVCLS